MAYCPSCGSSVEGRFCAKCGTAIPAPAAPASASGAAYGTAPAAPPPPAYNAPPPQYNAPPPGYGAAPPPPGYNPPPPGYGQPGYGQPGYGQQGYVPPPQQYAAAPGLQENVASALCYIPFVGWIIAIVFLVMAPYNQNRAIRLQAFQSIFLAVLMFVVSIVLSMFTWSLAYGVGMWGLMSMMILLVRLCFFGLLLFLMFKAYNRQPFLLPIIGPIAEKQANS